MQAKKKRNVLSKLTFMAYVNFLKKNYLFYKLIYVQFTSGFSNKVHLNSICF